MPERLRGPSPRPHRQHHPHDARMRKAFGTRILRSHLSRRDPFCGRPHEAIPTGCLCPGTGSRRRGGSHRRARHPRRPAQKRKRPTPQTDNRIILILAPRGALCRHLDHFGATRCTRPTGGSSARSGEPSAEGQHHLVPRPVDSEGIPARNRRRGRSRDDEGHAAHIRGGMSLDSYEAKSTSVHGAVRVQRQYGSEGP